MIVDEQGGEEIGQSVRQDIEGRGFAFVPLLRPGVETQTIAEMLGTISPIEGLSQTQQLKPLEQSEARPNIYSGNYGTGEFPFHSDLAHWHYPPRYFLLRCIVGVEDVATRLMEANEIVERVGTEQLHRALVRPRKRVRAVSPIMRLLERPAGNEWLLRWDDLFLLPATKSAELVWSEVKRTMAVTPFESVVLKQPGDTLVIDNWRMLHGRSQVVDGSKRRVVERVYMGDIR